MKTTYIELMSKALTAYSDEHIHEYFARVKAEGLTEHGFPRLTANLGVLITHGVREDLLPLFTEMMDFCCNEVARGVKAANEFSVRELVTCLFAVEKAGVIPEEKIVAWREALAKVTPQDCYNQVVKRTSDQNRNWILFGAVSEYLRQYAGLADVQDYVDLCVEQQMQFLDENGMYRDRKGSEFHNPMVYDMVSRGLFALLFHFGYRGPHYEEIDAKLKKAGVMMLEMQSVTGELPFGGRSNQFVHNEAWLATLCEYEACRYAREGDLATASKFKARAARALGNMREWLDCDPIHHIKNRFPLDTNYGCEGYGYFDKYMITAASFLYTAYLVCDETIPVGEDVNESCVGRTSHHFHKTYLQTENYTLEFDTNPDPDYETIGLGRVHRKGAPSAICLSVPCPAKPHYTVDLEDIVPLSLRPVAVRDGEIIPDDDASCEVVSMYKESSFAMMRMITRLNTGGTGGTSVDALYTVDNCGIDIALRSNKPFGFLIPAFSFDGENEVEVKLERGKVLTVFYKGYRCRYRPDCDIVDTGKMACNRNGHYRVFALKADRHMRIHMNIEKM